jgi:hypothetical protein
MSEPKRWLEEGAPGDIEHLVRAAKRERPDEASLARTLSAVGIGVGVTSAAAAAKAAGAAAGAGGTAKATLPITGGLLAKWTALGAAIGTLAVGAVRIVTDAPRMPGVPASSVTPSARARSGFRAPVPVLSTPRPAGPGVAPDLPEPVPVPPETRAHVTPQAAADNGPAPAAPLDAETLAAEVKSVDRARAALAVGKAETALAELDEYERRFRRRGFGPEALYLRMEAFLSLGMTAQARDAAERLLARYPKSLHAARARVVLAKKTDRLGAGWR